MRNDVTSVSVINRAIAIAVWSVIALTSAVTAQPAGTKPEAMQQPTSNASTQEDERYRIGPGDLLDIRIFNRPLLSRDAVRVEGNGMIRMPLIDGEIQAACKTEGELAKEIAVRLIKQVKPLTSSADPDRICAGPFPSRLTTPADSSVCGSTTHCAAKRGPTLTFNRAIS